MARFVVTGTGTDVGKTVFAAGLAGLIGADYWKPVQSGLVGNLVNSGGTGAAHPAGAARTAVPQAPQAQTDAADITALSGARVFPEAYRLSQPLSPHRAAEIDGVEIRPDLLTPPDADPLVIEGAGGVLVPLTRRMVFADLFADWGIPVIVVASTGLGTISYSLTALESLRTRGVLVHGMAFIGDDNPDNMATIGEMGRVRVLGRLPWLADLNRQSLGAAMQAAFDPDDFI